jgi:hypothetical protein
VSFSIPLRCLLEPRLPVLFLGPYNLGVGFFLFGFYFFWRLSLAGREGMVFYDLLGIETTE